MINNLIKPYKKTNNEDKKENISNQEENNEDKKENISNQEENNEDKKENMSNQEENNEDKKENISNQEENNEESKNNDIKDDEENNKEIWSVTFTSNEKGINYPITCTSNEKFSDLLERFLKENHEFRDPVYFYISNSFIMDKNKTLKENNIKDHSIILINISNLNSDD